MKTFTHKLTGKKYQAVKITKIKVEGEMISAVVFCEIKTGETKTLSNHQIKRLLK